MSASVQNNLYIVEKVTSIHPLILGYICELLRTILRHSNTSMALRHIVFPLSRILILIISKKDPKIIKEEVGHC